MESNGVEHYDKLWVVGVPESVLSNDSENNLRVSFRVLPFVVVLPVQHTYSLFPLVRIRGYVQRVRSPGLSVSQGTGPCPGNVREWRARGNGSREARKVRVSGDSCPRPGGRGKCLTFFALVATRFLSGWYWHFAYFGV